MSSRTRDDENGLSARSAKRAETTDRTRSEREDSRPTRHARDRDGAGPDSEPEAGADRTGSVGRLVQLQRTHGNQAVQSMLSASQSPSLRVGRPDGPAEREADRVAEGVLGNEPSPDVQLRASGVSVQRQLLEEEREEEEEEGLAGERTSPVDRESRRESAADEEPVPGVGRLGDARESTGAQGRAIGAPGGPTGAPGLVSAEAGAIAREEDEELIQAETVSGQTPGPASAVASHLGGYGRPMESPTREFFEDRFGRSFEDVRVHTGPQADEAARSMNAEAFTHGRDVYFRSGRYDPASERGRGLIAHELTHTIQQRPERMPAVAPGRRPSLTAPDGRAEREAESAADRVAAGDGVRSMGFSAATEPVVARQVAGTGPAGTTSEATTRPGPATGGSDAEREGERPAAPGEYIDLQGATYDTVAAAIDDRRGEEDTRRLSVPMRFDDMAYGTVEVVRRGRDGYATDGVQPIRLLHPALEGLRDSGIDPVLAVRIHRRAITGYLSVGAGRSAPKKPALVRSIARNPELLGWAGFSDLTLDPDNVDNRLENGTLYLRINDFGFELGGHLSGTGSFGLVDDTVTFDASATVAVPGVSETAIVLARDESGSLSGRVEVPVTLEKFSGTLIAEYRDEALDIQGTVGYESEKFGGELTLLVTDAETARNVALERLGPDAVEQAAEEATGQGRRRRRREAGLALAGYGTLNVHMTEWLTGTAQVIVDNEGHITVVGQVAPPAEVVLFEQRDFVHALPRIEVRAYYGLPVVGNLNVFAGVGIEALATMGPGKITNITLDGTYSTDPRVFDRVSLAGTLSISAFAGLRLRAEGGAGIEIADHDVKAGVGLNALAGARGYVEATPTIGYRETAVPEEGKQGEFFIAGRMELSAQPFLGLGGDLFVALDSPWWSPAPDKRWTWPLGSLEYPLPGEFGIAANVEHVVGSGTVPDVEFSDVDFDPGKFMSDLMRDEVPRGRGTEKQATGTFEDTSSGPPETPQVGGEERPGAGRVERPPQRRGGQTEPSPARAATGRQPAGGQEPPSPAKAQAMQRAMAALRDLAEASRRDPYTREEIDAALGRLRRQHEFASLTVTAAGDDWVVTAVVNPPVKTKIEREDSETPGEPDPREETDRYDVSRAEIERRFRHRLDPTYVFQLRDGVWTVQRGRGRATGPGAAAKVQLVDKGRGSYGLETLTTGAEADARAAHEQILSERPGWGPYLAGKEPSIPGYDHRNFTADTTKRVNKIGEEHGDHSDRSIQEPGTRSENWIPDHQPPLSVGKGGASVTYRFYPHSLESARRQAGIVTAYMARMKRVRDRGNTDWAVGVQSAWFWGR